MNYGMKVSFNLYHWGRSKPKKTGGNTPGGRVMDHILTLWVCPTAKVQFSDLVLKSRTGCINQRSFVKNRV